MASRICVPYGLACEIDFDWPSVPSAPAGPRADLRITLGDLGPYAGLADGAYEEYASRSAGKPDAPPTVRIQRARDGHYRVHYVDGAEFILDLPRARIHGRALEGLTHEDLLVYLQGPILGLALRLRGRTCLHGSAIVVDGRAVVFAGDAGAGKSTTAAALALRGETVLADDVVALRDDAALHVDPGPSRLLLWPESVTALRGDQEAMPRMVPTWDKRYLDLRGPGLCMAEAAAPLGAIYVLKARSSDLCAPQLTQVTGAEALIELVTHSYANDFLDRALRGRELDAVGRIVRQVPIFAVSMPDDRAALFESCAALLEHAQAWLRRSSCAA